MRVAHEIGLPVCEMWGEVEAGLDVLAQGQPAAALEHTGQAVARVPQAHEGWIGTEQVHRVHARVLQALYRAEDADEQTRWAASPIPSSVGAFFSSGWGIRLSFAVKL